MLITISGAEGSGNLGSKGLQLTTDERSKRSAPTLPTENLAAENSSMRHRLLGGSDAHT